MAKMIPDSVWALYENTVNNFIENDAGLQPIRWLRKSLVPAMYGEDNNLNYSPVDLEGLIQYNHIRAWPFDQQTVSGALDKANIVLYITKRQLLTKGFIDDHQNWDINTSEDRFILNGLVYKPSGTTPVAQAKDRSLLYFVVLEQEDSHDSAEIVSKYLS